MCNKSVSSFWTWLTFRELVIQPNSLVIRPPLLCSASIALISLSFSLVMMQKQQIGRTPRSLGSHSKQMSKVIVARFWYVQDSCDG